MEKNEMIKLLVETLKLSSDTLHKFAITVEEAEARKHVFKLIEMSKQLIDTAENELGSHDN